MRLETNAKGIKILKIQLKWINMQKFSKNMQKTLAILKSRVYNAEHNNEPNKKFGNP